MAPSGYLFLEVSVIVFFLGFGWEQFKLRELGCRNFWVAAASLASFWFIVDQVAVRLGLWKFPDGGTLPFRLFSLPVEEYALFFVHTLLCFILLNIYSKPEE